MYEGYRGAIPVTPSDATVYSPMLSGLYVGGAGNITVRLHGNTTDILFAAVPVGTILEIGPISQVRATGTAATNIVGLVQ
jgi:hypothetical protein